MEKQPSLKSPHEWETLIDTFSSLSLPPSLPLDLLLASLLRRDFPLPTKLHLLIFLEQTPSLLPSLTPFLDFLRSLLPDPSPTALKEQSIVTATSLSISLDTTDVRELESLVEILLGLINRPNHGADRQLRAVACECLRELENSTPGLLSEISGHLWSLSQSERTHAAQSYMLLFAAVVRNAVVCGGGTESVLSTVVPLVPFNVPERREGEGFGNLKEVRKVMAFLLERPLVLTPFALMELVGMLVSIVDVLGLHGSVAALFNVQFFGLIYSFDPILCHVVLFLYSKFADAFAGDEERIVDRLALVSKETQRPLVFRLLALHWLLGITASRPPEKKRIIVPMYRSFYPVVFDPLALKALKLDVLARIATYRGSLVGEEKVGEKDTDISMAKLFEDGLVCISDFKWLPIWSTETCVAFRTMHKFLIGALPRSNGVASDVHVILESVAFRVLQDMLVKLTLENHGLVPAVGEFLDRLNGCESTQLVGELLLQSIDEHLLPQLTPSYQLSLYFPIFDRISKNDTIPPRCLLELLINQMLFLVKKHGPETGLRSWSHGSKVLSICRELLSHHHSSRVFFGLSHLLMFTCQFFPDLEVRDNARIYLRMLLCVPGKKLRHILSFGKQLQGATPSPNPASLFHVPSPRSSQSIKKTGISSYIHVERVVPLLVKQSWSLTLPNFSEEVITPDSFEGIRDATVSSSQGEHEKQDEFKIERIVGPDAPLCVTDSKVADILDILRKHFGTIPDFRHMLGLKIKIPCSLWFESEPFSCEWDVPSTNSEKINELPALYASVVKFSSTSKYSSIPSCRVPFLLGEPSGSEQSIVPVGNASKVNSSWRASVMIELEPREPLPGLIDVVIEANGENGQIISGSLDSIPVGIEDMFLKACLPSNVPTNYVKEYYYDLFHALWEACGSAANTGRETFPLKGGKGVAAISGTRSVKLLEIPAESLVCSIEQYLAPFVVSVIGSSSLIELVRYKGVISDIIWKEDDIDSSNSVDSSLVPYTGGPPLQLTYGDGDDAMNDLPVRKKNIGTILILIFLPPRFHLLFQMEVDCSSTLVRIRTDHWPCLAFVDEYLEACFFS